MDEVNRLFASFIQFILEHDLFFTLLFIGRFISITAVELWHPTRTVDYRSVLRYDLTVYLLYQFVVFPVATQIDGYLAVRPHLPAMILEMPIPLRLLCYVVVTDFAHYWIHRLMHTKPVWRIHKWHHAPTYMYWLAGVRTTVPQQVLVSLPYVVAWSLLDLSPWWMGLAVGAFYAFQNDWMHVNVTWRSNWLEWVFVTPRYHHIHHSIHPAHYMANLAALLTLWDRLFGTYVDPDKVEASRLSFGLEEPVPLPRLMLGI